jgi:hypothetical protein
MFVAFLMIRSMLLDFLLCIMMQWPRCVLCLAKAEFLRVVVLYVLVILFDAHLIHTRFSMLTFPRLYWMLHMPDVFRARSSLRG